MDINFVKLTTKLNFLDYVLDNYDGISACYGAGV